MKRPHILEIKIGNHVLVIGFDTNSCIESHWGTYCKDIQIGSFVIGWYEEGNYHIFRTDEELKELEEMRKRLFGKRR